MSRKNDRSKSATASGLRHAWLFALLLFVATAAAYTSAWNGKPLWDDDAHITRPDLRSLDGLAHIWLKPGATQQYYPLAHSVFWIEHKLWGDAPLGYHFTNILLHACAALLLVKILQRLQVRGAWLAGAIFALHPVQVESVAWISELKNTLSGLCYLGAALVYLEFDRNRKRGLYAVAFFLFVLGLASKTVVATLPAALLLVFWWQHKKLTWNRDVAPLIPFFVIGIAAGIFTASIESGFVGVHNPEFHFGWVDRFLIAGRAFWFYLSKLFWPAHLIFTYPRWRIDPAVWWQYLFPAAALLLVVILLFMHRRARGILVAVLYFGGTLFPALGFFNVYPFRYSFVADHFQYLASIGPIVLATTGLTAAFDWLDQRKLHVRQILSAALLLLLGALTWRQCAQYVDLETLWRTTLAKNPDAWLAHNNLGEYLVRAGHIDEAVTHFERAVEINPNSSEAHNNLGNLLLTAGRVRDAIAHFNRALEINPAYAVAHYNLGNAFLQSSKLDDAVAHFEKALELNRNDIRAHNNLSAVYLQLGKVDQAVAHLNQAIAIDPNNAQVHNNAGNVFLRLGKIDEAVSHFEKALDLGSDHADRHTAEIHLNLANALLHRGEIDQGVVHYQKAIEISPDYAEAHANLGIAYQLQEHFADAIAEYEKAMAIAPNSLPNRNNLAALLATCQDLSLRDGTRAVQVAQEAVRLSGGDDPMAFRTLAAAFAETGRFTEAITAAEKALQLATQQENDSLSSAVQRELDIYRTQIQP